MIKIPAQQSKPSFTPLKKAWRPSKKNIHAYIFLSAIEEPTNRTSKEPNMPTRAQANPRRLTLHQPKAMAPHKKASIQLTRESGEIPYVYLPGSIPIHLDWGLPPR